MIYDSLISEALRMRKADLSWKVRICDGCRMPRSRDDYHDTELRPVMRCLICEDGTRCRMCKGWLVLGTRRRSYCGDECSEEANRIRAFLRYQIIHIGLRLRDHDTLTPRWSKSLWEGIGEWSSAYSRCEECRGTTYRYKGNGLCARCYERLRQRERSREAKDQMNIGSYERKKLSVYRAKRYLEKLKKGKVIIDPTVTSLSESLRSVTNALKKRRYSKPDYRTITKEQS